MLAIFDKIKFNCFCGTKSNRSKSRGAVREVENIYSEPDDISTHKRSLGDPNSSDDIEPKPPKKTRVKQRKHKSNHKFDGRHRYTIYDEVSTMGERYNITILPVHANFRIDNLYPETNQVHKWNIIIIGKDKTFVHVSIHDLDMPGFESFPNRRSGNVLDRHLQDFFDPIFDKTLNNEKLQFVMGWSQRIYLVNTYPLTNQVGTVIGGVVFIRDYSLMPKMTFAPLTHEESQISDANIPQRKSKELTVVNESTTI